MATTGKFVVGLSNHLNVFMTSSGTFVVDVTAEDYDDGHEGGNARLTYSLQKNAVDEDGRPVFSVDPQNGRISTAICCLDRERASHYSLTVLATDGGGLQGKGYSHYSLTLLPNDGGAARYYRHYNVTILATDGLVRVRVATTASLT